MSPKTYWRTYHPQRVAKSPSRQSRSPGMNGLGLGVNRGASNTLPPISQFAQTMKSAFASPVQTDAASVDKSGSEERQQLMGIQEHNIEPDMAVASIRRSSETAINDCKTSTMVSGHDEITPSEMEQINNLREENVGLRDRIQRLELIS
ncbi:hypothetical protein GGF43_000001 [Coemansia sp. RSA 2618]|nr:hypothetical protein GGF43_000001 [Coemansia sp. RSA 2618]